MFNSLRKEELRREAGGREIELTLEGGSKVIGKISASDEGCRFYEVPVETNGSVRVIQNDQIKGAEFAGKSGKSNPRNPYFD